MEAGEQSDLEAVLAHRFARPELLRQALTHASLRHEAQTAAAAGREAGKAGVQRPVAAERLAAGREPVQAGAAELVADNERMEFLGDAIVGLVVAELLYQRYPELDEGELTRLRAALVSRKHLGEVGIELGLGGYLRLGKAEERMGGRGKAVLLANCMEALIAALYLEGGLETAARFVERTVHAPYVEALRDELRARRSIGDWKTALQELLQARRGVQPEYVLKAESGPDHRKRFVVEVRVRRGDGAQLTASGEGTTKKKAEQEGARRMYERLAGRTGGAGGESDGAEVGGGGLMAGALSAGEVGSGAKAESAGNGGGRDTGAGAMRGKAGGGGAGGGLTGAQGGRRRGWVGKAAPLPSAASEEVGARGEAAAKATL